MNSRLLAMAAALLCAGCSTTAPNGELEASTMGEANRTTFAAQVVDPDPQYAEDATVGGQRTADAVERYRKGTVKQPERVTSRSASGASGGGGGGSSGN